MVPMAYHNPHRHYSYNNISNNCVFAMRQKEFRNTKKKGKRNDNKNFYLLTSVSWIGRTNRYLKHQVSHQGFYQVENQHCWRLARTLCYLLIPEMVLVVPVVPVYLWYLWFLPSASQLYNVLYSYCSRLLICVKEVKIVSRY